MKPRSHDKLCMQTVQQEGKQVIEVISYGQDEHKMSLAVGRNASALPKITIVERWLLFICLWHFHQS